MPSKLPVCMSAMAYFPGYISKGELNLLNRLLPMMTEVLKCYLCSQPPLGAGYAGNGSNRVEPGQFLLLLKKVEPKSSARMQLKLTLVLYRS